MHPAIDVAVPPPWRGISDNANTVFKAGHAYLLPASWSRCDLGAGALREFWALQPGDMVALKFIYEMPCYSSLDTPKVKARGKHDPHENRLSSHLAKQRLRRHRRRY